MKSRRNFGYKYRMVGLDTTWYQLKSEVNFARFPSLPPGNYIFEVKGVNEDGFESEVAAAVGIYIAKAWFNTWWFYLISSIMLVGLAYIGFNKRIAYINERNAFEQALKTHQLTALRSQMNPHFIFNVLNSIQEFIMLNDKKQANFYLGRFSDLIRTILYMSQNDKILLEDELNALNIYLELEALRFGESFYYEVNIAPEVNPKEIHIPSMIIQPYIENAVKHGLLHKMSNRQLYINFSINKEKDCLTCVVKDNGIGRKRAAELQQQRNKRHQSFATKANQDRLELINQGRKKLVSVSYHDLMEDEKPSGTAVHINIPIL
jgi:sensor histidine kinase YesM